ncbi:hypothetical protein MNBD_BACTEROID07-1061 [hydrothermal vent metagenome]|uniref:DUF4831 family protein n=1 Tax=hydrothermal vent metagenome TaxID=652676 RepID=A0A3B0UFV3_9ZZZZ
MNTRTHTLQLLLLFPLFLFFMQAEAQTQYQFQVTKATGKQMVATPAGGIYYALPKTIFKIRLAMEQVNEIPGPFAAYATKYLGTTDYMKAKKVYYRLLSVKIVPVTIADPAQMFYVRFPENRSSKEIRRFALRLNDEGVLVGFGLAPKPGKKNTRASASSPVSSSQMYVFSDYRKGFDMQAGYTRAQKVDTIVRKITIDTVTIKRFLYKTGWVNLTEEERANDAAKQIKNIRTSRFNLLTGYQEVNYGEGIRYMDVELQKMAHEYMVLFLGREYRQMVVRSFVFDPEKKALSGKLLQFADEDGNTHTLNIKVRIINQMTHVAGRKTAGPDALFYRIPVKAVISVGSGSNPFYSDTFEVPQLGVITTVPVRKNTRLRLSPKTGALLGIDKQ